MIKKHKFLLITIIFWGINLSSNLSVSSNGWKNAEITTATLKFPIGLAKNICELGNDNKKAIIFEYLYRITDIANMSLQAKNDFNDLCPLLILFLAYDIKRLFDLSYSDFSVSSDFEKKYSKIFVNQNAKFKRQFYIFVKNGGLLCDSLASLCYALDNQPINILQDKKRLFSDIILWSKLASESINIKNNEISSKLGVGFLLLASFLFKKFDLKNIVKIKNKNVNSTLNKVHNKKLQKNDPVLNHPVEEKNIDNQNAIEELENKSEDIENTEKEDNKLDNSDNKVISADPKDKQQVVSQDDLVNKEEGSSSNLEDNFQENNQREKQHIKDEDTKEEDGSTDIVDDEESEVDNNENEKAGEGWGSWLKNKAYNFGQKIDAFAQKQLIN